MGRRLGQHFLVQESTLARIARAACDVDGRGPGLCRLVIEIGPGRGALTRHLLERAERVHAIEVDPVLCGQLRLKYGANSRFQLVENDVLKVDLAQWGQAVIAGNLPYYITSPILEHALSLGTRLVRAVFLVQKEVAERLAAEPGSRNYGFLTVRTQVRAEVKLLFSVPAKAFRPMPKVDSAVVRLIPRPVIAVKDVAGFVRFAGNCFKQKRKTLRNNLEAVYPGLGHFPEARLRAEQLTIPQLIALWQRVEAPT
ncbi:MAG: ribosomal RNA small subunit methyltransferase A [Acidobacteria bacterium]|nr:ribosomal RNA small subunit methyltransferase A [Acidobacteriota bacterium]